MIFTAKTVTIWQAPKPDSALITLADDRADLLASQGVTDGVVTRQSLPNGQLEITRNWTTVEAADEWLAFITTYEPQSVEVVLL